MGIDEKAIRILEHEDKKDRQAWLEVTYWQYQNGTHGGSQVKINKFIPAANRTGYSTYHMVFSLEDLEWTIENVRRMKNQFDKQAGK